MKKKLESDPLMTAICSELSEHMTAQLEKLDKVMIDKKGEEKIKRYAQKKIMETYFKVMFMPVEMILDRENKRILFKVTFKL